MAHEAMVAGRTGFERRAELTELMDGPCPYETLRDCLRSIEQINRLTLSYRPTLRFLETVSALDPARPLKIVDVGSGYGDMLREIYRWGQRRGVRLTLTGIDLNPHAARAAREAAERAGLPKDAIAWVTGDAFSMEFAAPPDLIVSSLFTHHLPHAELVRFLAWMEATAEVGWFINDLERQPLPARLFGLLARVMRWHPFVLHDGPVSFRRAFREADWRSLLAEAGVDEDAVSVERVFPARLCVARLR